MRLRPSGRQGPVATSLAAFKAYQRSDAWTWEHLALTRARVIAGDPALGRDIEAFRQTLLKEKSQGAAIVADVADMRRRIAEAKPDRDVWDVKIGPGRLQDIELFAQTAALRAGAAVRDLQGQFAVGVAGGWLNAADVQALTQAAGLFWRLQTVMRLLTGEVLDMGTLGEGAKRLVLRQTQTEAISELAETIEDAAERSARVISKRLAAS
jgi:glutamate-ammonia-ligase adenylyltransferase